MIDSVAVLVPVRNEEALLPRLITSIDECLRETRSSRPDLAISVTFSLDECTDGSAELIGEAGYQAVRPPHTGVGTARQTAAAYAIEAVANSSRPGLWLANTDADSVVPRNWLLHQVELADGGADVVIGIVQPVGLDEDRRLAWEATHRGGQALGHVHGANLGIRASTYLAAGGFEAVGEHEDVDLARRAALVGGQSVATDAHPVLTSGRLVGRTAGGYAGYLREELLPLANSSRDELVAVDGLLR